MEVDRGFGMMKKGGSKLGDWVTSKNEIIKKKKNPIFIIIAKISWVVGFELWVNCLHEICPPDLNSTWSQIQAQVLCVGSQTKWDGILFALLFFVPSSSVIRLLILVSKKERREGKHQIVSSPFIFFMRFPRSSRLKPFEASWAVNLLPGQVCLGQVDLI